MSEIDFIPSKTEYGLLIKRCNEVNNAHTPEEIASASRSVLESILKYKEKFGECFPLMLTKGMGDKKIEDIIKNCIENNSPYEVDEEGDY